MKRRTEDVEAQGRTATLLVCTEDRDARGPCCADAGARAVVGSLVERLEERDLTWTDVAVCTTSCLGLCSEGGAAAAVQPRDEWYSDVRPGDVPDLLEAALDSDGDGGGDGAETGNRAGEGERSAGSDGSRRSE